MSQSFKTTFWVLLFSLLAGLSLALFGHLESFIKYLFSLVALYIGIVFFRRYETTGLRILFVALSLIFYFLTAIVVAMMQYLRDNPDLLTTML